jgi:hypothetical protein
VGPHTGRYTKHACAWPCSQTFAGQAGRGRYTLGPTGTPGASTDGTGGRRCRFRKIIHAWRGCSNYAKLFLGEPIDVPVDVAPPEEQERESAAGGVRAREAGDEAGVVGDEGDGPLDRNRRMESDWGPELEEPSPANGVRFWPAGAEAEADDGDGDGDSEPLDDDGKTQVLLLTERPDMEPLLSFEMPCSVEEFFELFWSDASEFFRTFLECEDQGCTVHALTRPKASPAST